MFYDNLKKICKSKGTSVTALLKDIGLSTSNGTVWKNGTLPTGEILIKIANKLEVSVDSLLGLERDPPKEPAAGEIKMLDNYERRLLDLFRQLDPVEKGIILRRTEELVEAHETAFEKKKATD